MFVFNVDDDSDDREIFLDAVNTVDPHISCVQVESGISALQFLNRSDILPDYLFIDMNMPKMTGLECVENIRSVARCFSVQIVMYSITFSPKDETYLTKMGITCLQKKSKLSDLVNSLDAILLNKIPVLAE